MRLISTAIAVVFLIVTILASTESVSAAAKLKVTAERQTIYVGETVKVKANKKVKWSVSKKKIVKLAKVKRKTVTVKGLKPGTVYVKAKNGKKTKKIKITVKDREVSVNNSMRLVSSREYIGIGESCSVTVIGSSAPVPLDDISFSSSDESVATVYYTGLVTGIKPGTATITATNKKDKSVTSSVNITVVAAKAGVLKVTIDMTDENKYPAGKPVKAWFQVPVSDDNQTISSVKYDEANATIVKDSSGAQAYYIEWGPEVAPADRVATLSFHVYRRAVLNGAGLRSKESGAVDTGNPELMEWLRETTYSGSLTDGIVKETADKIVSDAGAVTVYDKAHAIYLWICENITRDKTMPDRELGDVVKILSGDKIAGSCIDINSIFVSLCNAEGIPARESFGYKIYEDPSKLGQNCRAEFYLSGFGWVEVDPAMPLGRVMNGAVEKGTPAWETIKETYWTSGSADWICQNHGRDLTFDPPGELNAAPGYMINPDGTLNHFMFPHGEYDGQYIPGYGNYASEFKYVYEFKEEDPLDCGC
jgi:transglutaminase-like putative cysteine protease